MSYTDDEVYSVYFLIDPRDSVIRYVGCSRNTAARLVTHLREPNSNGPHRQPKKDAWLKELASGGITPRIKVVFESKDKRLARVVEHAFQGAHCKTITNNFCGARLPTVGTVIGAAVVRYLARQMIEQADWMRDQARRRSPTAEDVEAWASSLESDAQAALAAMGMDRSHLPDEVAPRVKARMAQNPVEI